MTTVEDYLRQPIFVDVLLSMWFRELDFMYDIVLGTEASELWQCGELNSASYPKFTALLATILALTAQLNAVDLDACLDSCLGDHPPSQGLISPALALAELRIEAVTMRPEDAASILPEHLQAHFLLCAFDKNTGQLNKYRAKLVQGISHLFNASYHILDAFEYDQSLNDAPHCMTAVSSTPASIRSLMPAQRHLVRRLFWNLFACDRLFVMLGGVPSSYMINVFHADIWLPSHSGRRRHVHDVCAGNDDGQHSSPHTPFHTGRFLSNTDGKTLGAEAGSAPVSAYIEALVYIAATCGRCMDCVAAIRAYRHRKFVGEEEKEVVQQCLKQASIIEAEIKDLRQAYCTSGQEGGRLVSIRGALAQTCARQRQVLMLTVLRLQRDLALEVSSVLYGVVPERRAWLDAQQTSTAHALLKHGLAATLDFAPRSMAWIFFLHYIAEPSRSLVEALYRCTTLTATLGRECLSLAVRGRNLLCLIAVQSGSPLAFEWAHGLCTQLSETIMDGCAFGVAEVEELQHGHEQDEAMIHSLRVFRAAQSAVQDLSRSICADEFADAFARLHAVKPASSSRSSESLCKTNDPHYQRTTPQLAAQPSDTDGEDVHNSAVDVLHIPHLFMMDMDEDELLEANMASQQFDVLPWTEMEGSTALDMLLSLPLPFFAAHEDHDA